MGTDELQPSAGGNPLVLDACTVINLAASDKWREILAAAGVQGVIAPAVAREAISVADPDSEGTPHQIDLTELAAEGFLRIEQLTEQETASWVELAAQLGDGEAASLALAQHRSWRLASDDRKARTAHMRLKISARLWSTSELVRTWAENTGRSAGEVAEVVRRIESLGSFVPGPHDPEIEWWEQARQGRRAA